jgi:hypothetical protein
MQLKEVVQSMLIKDAQMRPSVIQILKDPYVQSFMSSFVENRGVSLLSSRTLTYRRTNTYQMEKGLPQEETPKQRLARTKMERADQEAERVKQAIRDTRKPGPASPGPNTMSLSGSGSTIAALQFNTRSPYDAQPDKFNSPAVLDRPINASGKYDLSMIETEMEDIDSTEDVVPQDLSEMSKQVEVYRHQLGEATAVPGGRLEEIKETSGESGSLGSSTFDRPIAAAQQNKVARMRKTCMDMFGEEKFQEVYRAFRRMKESRTEESAVVHIQIVEALVKTFGKQYQKLFYSIEELLFFELGH